MTELADLPRWNLDPILPRIGTDGFDQAFSSAVEAVRHLTRLFDERGIGVEPVASIPPEAFEEVFAGYLAVRAEVRLIEGYLECLTAADTRDVDGQAKQSEFQPTVASMSILLTRLTAWVGAADVEALPAGPTLARDHRHFLRRCAVRSRHLMTPMEESLAAALTTTGSIAWERLHGNVTSQLMVPVTLDGQGRSLPMAAVRNLEEHPDRAVRQEAHRAEIEAWRSVRVPLAAALNSVKGEVTLLAQRRGWTSPLEATLFDHAIDRPILDAMMGAADESFPDFRRYLRCKALRLGLDRLAWWDLYAPVVAQGRAWPYGAAQGFLLRHFAGFSPALAATAERAFSENWIDVAPREGKVGGAFCTWMRGEESRILCNFEPTYSWTSTLAHELGHAYHNRTRAGRTILQRRTPATLAETASIFCETLIEEAAYAEAGPSDRLAILEAFLQTACAIVVDVSGRFFFEQEVFERRGSRELSADELCDEMRSAQSRSYGDGLDPHTYHEYMWAVKPHYYSGSESFYNYPYTFGLLFGLGLFAAYRENPKTFVPRYEDLLSRTGMATAAELAEEFGIDLRSPGFWRSALDMVRERIARFEELSQSV
ncbi:MAG TPA: M3 family oligoendopeptidase [Anaerolineales bacterium]|nr:M3 family oligoendopeptidase [Anaerolineales bacterium]